MAPTIYDETIELFSLHAHLHLRQQVLLHGGLAYNSAFCFESAIRNLKKKAHGTRDLATQISEWIETETILPHSTNKLSKLNGLNAIKFNSKVFHNYRSKIVEILDRNSLSVMDLSFFLRFTMNNVLYHTVLYDSSFNCTSHIVSFTDDTASIKYGQVIVFFKDRRDFYAIVDV